MKFDTVFVRAVGGAFVLLFSTASVALFSAGAPPARTGAPGDTGTCANGGCHDSFALNSGDGSVAITAPPEYTPGETIQFTVRVSDPSASQYGFEVTAKTDDTMLVGEWDVSDPAIQLTGGNVHYVTHDPAPLAAGGFTWTLTWTAPPNEVGNITLYAAGNAANNGGSNKDDFIYTTSHVFSPSLVTATESLDVPGDIGSMTIYPNPFIDNATVRYSLDRSSNVVLELYDVLARRVLSQDLGSQAPGTHEWAIPAHDLPAGVLFFRLRTERSSRMGMAILTR